jgi:hypothetical protein
MRIVYIVNTIYTIIAKIGFPALFPATPRTAHPFGHHPARDAQMDAKR